MNLLAEAEVRQHLDSAIAGLGRFEFGERGWARVPLRELHLEEALGSDPFGGFVDGDLLRFVLDEGFVRLVGTSAAASGCRSRRF